MLSIICVFNDERILNEALLRSLKGQSVPYDLVLLDNRTKRFGSAAEALNYGATIAKGEYFIFLHQDMFLCYNEWLSDAEKMLLRIPDLGIGGVAGVYERGKYWQERVKYAFMHRTDPAWKNVGPVTEPAEVQTLDECLLIIPRSVFNELKFDGITFDGWDCYAADYCLSVKRHGYRAYVLPLPCVHSSVRAYYHIWEFKNLHKYKKRLFLKHKTKYPKIYTLMGTISRLHLKIYSLVIFFGPVISSINILSYENIWRRIISDCDSILDVGCGISSPVQFCNISYSKGIDIAAESCDECRRLGLHDDVVHADARMMPDSYRGHDAVIGVEILEYLEKEEGIDLIRKMESWAQKKVVIVSVNGSIAGNSNPIGDSAIQKSIWKADDFRRLGYSLKGIRGWKRLRDESGVISTQPTWLWNIVSLITEYIVFFIPEHAYQILAVKNKR
ncbi:MAG TPA: glycosyltransferase [Spirochaetota bacterium]|nr:glycosyltransferase [Spirochaetota bacterium]